MATTSPGSRRDPPPGSLRGDSTCLCVLASSHLPKARKQSGNVAAGNRVPRHLLSRARRRAKPRLPPGGSPCRAHHDRAHAGSLRPLSRATAADSAYGSADARGLIHERGIEPTSQSSTTPSARRDLRASRLQSRSQGRCLYLPWREGTQAAPEGLSDAAPSRRRERHDALSRQQAGLRGCWLKPRCCPNAPARKILRSIHEDARDMARDIAATDAYVTSRRERKKVEMLFAHLKRILKLDRLRLRGPNGARDEFHLAATAQNLRKLAKLIPMPEPTPA